MADGDGRESRVPRPALSLALAGLFAAIWQFMNVSSGEGLGGRAVLRCAAVAMATWLVIAFGDRPAKSWAVRAGMLVLLLACAWLGDAARMLMTPAGIG